MSPEQIEIIKTAETNKNTIQAFVVCDIGEAAPNNQISDFYKNYKNRIYYQVPNLEGKIYSNYSRKHLQGEYLKEDNFPKKSADAIMMGMCTYRDTVDTTVDDELNGVDGHGVTTTTITYEFTKLEGDTEITGDPIILNLTKGENWCIGYFIPTEKLISINRKSNILTKYDEGYTQDTNYSGADQWRYYIKTSGKYLGTLDNTTNIGVEAPAEPTKQPLPKRQYVFTFATYDDSELSGDAFEKNEIVGYAQNSVVFTGGNQRPRRRKTSRRKPARKSRRLRKKRSHYTSKR